MLINEIGASHAVYLVVKAPRVGEVKTRLFAAYSPEQATQIYKEAVLAIIENLNLAPDALFLFSNDIEHEWLQMLATRYGYSLVQQPVGSLGERLKYACEHAARQRRQAILLGGDCVSIRASDINACIDAADDYDCIIKPAEDGGYLALSLRPQLLTKAAAIFSEPQWGSDSVLACTLQILREQGLSYKKLSPGFDLDRPEDVERWRQAK